MPQLKVAFILGDGYSGSTLLDLILGSHSRMMSLGEIDAESFDAFLDQNQLCTCLFKSQECHFWSRVLDRLRELTGEESFRLGGTRENWDKVTRNTVDLLQAVKNVSSSEILIDSSKLFQRAYSLDKSGLIQPKVIHLVRDGRGVGYSYLKRGGSFQQAVFHWKKKNAEVRDWLVGERPPDNITIRYEDLCGQPVDVIRRICKFLDVDWEPQMMRFGQKVHHNVRGNTMRFLIKNSLIELDEDWKEKLKEDDLNLFEYLAGPFSRQLGYS